MPQQFNQPVHAFRGFAILNIAGIHAFAFILFYVERSGSDVGWSGQVLGLLNGVLLHDSTLYFTLISGILFSLVLAERGTARFFRSKFLNVLLPYLFFTTLYSSMQPSGPPGSPPQLFDGTLFEFVKLVAYNLVTGKAILIFWYMPVLLVLYLLTPFLAKIAQARDATWLHAIIICTPLVISRTATEFSWQSIVFFLGAYFVGMLVGANYRATIQLIEKHVVLLVVTAVVTSLSIVALGHYEITNYGVFIPAQTAWYLQKFAIAALVLLWFEQVIEVVPRWLDVLANYAFALYFIHAFLLIQLVMWMTRNQIQIDGGFELVAYMGLSFTIAVGGSVLLIYLLKLILRKYSRYIIGA